MCSRGRVYILPRFLFFLSVIFLLQAEKDDFYGKRGSSMKMKKEKIRFKPLAAVVFAVVLAAVMLASALISAKAAPLTWQDICNRGESDLTAVAAYDLKAGCKDYGWNQTLDAGPDGTIYTGTNHHYDNVVGNEDSRVMYAHKLRVTDGMTVSIVAAQNDTEDEGGLTYIKGKQFR